jgi:UDP-N-acetylglucosamine 2-epimerase
MKVLSVVGARPQFIKAAVVSRALENRCKEILVHTGQHYDFEMSQVFFDQLRLRAPDFNLGIGSGGHGAQTGRMLKPLEDIVISEKPQAVLVYGDTNSTLAGSLVAAKCGVCAGHVEAGLRSFNWEMPEEVNRVVADRLSEWLFCPSAVAVRNLETEGLAEKAHVTGDVMLDALRLSEPLLEQYSNIFKTLNVSPGDYFILTIHRQENTRDAEFIRRVIETVGKQKTPTVFPVHPRSHRLLEEADLIGWAQEQTQVRLCDPLGYMEMLLLMKHSRKVLTDSGGMQKEAYYFGIPCVTMRRETEWVETVEAGWNTLAGADPEQIEHALEHFEPDTDRPPLYGGGEASERIAELLLSFL